MRLNANDKSQVTFTLNGEAVSALAHSRLLLTDMIRHVLRRTGTHVGCEHGVCGACTVRIDGVPARACLTLAVQAEGRQIETVESLAPPPGELSALQRAFRENFALQCGFCTPGILMSLDTLLRDNPTASDEDLKDALSGHLCRCTGYEQILRAARAAREARNA
ncbi:MAG: (2Fe-2S)-binding protein [Pseudomonadota bacterium]